MVLIKSSGIEDVLEGYADISTEERRDKQRVEGEFMFRGFEEVMGAYGKMSSYHAARGYSVQAAGIDAQYHAERLPALTPEQIALFTQAVAHYCTKDSGFITGHFITALIGRSYKARYNDFRFNTKAMVELPSYFGYQLEGKNGDEIRIKVDGSLGGNCCYGARHVRLSASEISGNAGGAKNVVIEAGKMGEISGVNITRYCFGASLNQDTMKCRILMSIAARIASCIYIIGDNDRKEVWARF